MNIRHTYNLEEAKYNTTRINTLLMLNEKHTGEYFFYVIHIA